MDVKKFGKHALRMANLPMDSGTKKWASDCNFGGLEGRKAVGYMIRARCRILKRRGDGASGGRNYTLTYSPDAEGSRAEMT